MAAVVYRVKSGETSFLPLWNCIRVFFGEVLGISVRVIFTVVMKG